MFALACTCMYENERHMFMTHPIQLLKAVVTGHKVRYLLTL